MRLMSTKASQKNGEFKEEVFELFDNEDSKSLYEKAKRFIKENNSKMATKIASCLNRRGEYQKTIELYKLLIQQKLGIDILSKKNLAHVLETSGNYEESFWYIEQIASRREMQNHEFYGFKARVLVAIGKFDDAIKYLNDLSLGEEIIVNAFTMACYLMERRREYEKTLKILEYMYTKYPSNPTVILTYVSDLHKCGQLDNLLSLLRAGIRNNPKNVDLKISYAFYLNKLNRSQDAINFIDSLRNEITNELIYIKAIAYFELGEYKKSEESCVFLLLKSPVEKNIRILLAKSYICQDKCDNARKLLPALAAEDPRAGWWHVYSYEREGNIKKALEIAEKYSINFPSDFKICLLYARLLDRQKSYRESEQVIRNGLTHHPKEVGLLLMLGAVLHRQNRILEAETCYINTREWHPNCSQAYHCLARFYEKIGEIASSEKCYLDAIKSFPGDATFKLILSILYYENNNYEKALKYAREALSQSTEYSGAISALQKFDFGSKTDPVAKRKNYAVAHSHDRDRIKRHTIPIMLEKIQYLPLLPEYKKFLVKNELVLDSSSKPENDLNMCLILMKEFEELRLSYCGESDAHKEALSTLLEGSLLKTKPRSARGLYVIAEAKFKNENYNTARIQFDKCLIALKEIIAGIKLPNIDVSVPPALEKKEEVLPPPKTQVCPPLMVDKVDEGRVLMSDASISPSPKKAELSENCFYTFFKSCKYYIGSVFEESNKEDMDLCKKTN